MATKTINISGKWVANGTEYGSYDLSYKIKSTISDNGKNVRVVITCTKLDVQTSSVYIVGRNTLCISAFLEPRFDNYYTVKVADDNPSSPTYIDQIKTDIAWASFNSTWNSIEDNMITFLTVGYNTYENSGMKQGDSRTFDLKLNSSIFKKSSLLIASNRFLNNNHGSGADYDGPTSDALGNPLGPGNTCVDTYSFNNPPLKPEDIAEDYYPGRIRKAVSGETHWMSCNRSDGGKARIRADGSWRDIKNSPIDGGSYKGRIRSDGGWTKQLLIGVDKDT